MRQTRGGKEVPKKVQPRTRILLAPRLNRVAYVSYAASPNLGRLKHNSDETIPKIRGNPCFAWFALRGGHISMESDVVFSFAAA